MADFVPVNRRGFLGMGALGLTGLLPGITAAASNDGVTVGDDGLFKQDWFLDSFLDVGEDLTEAAADGKGLMVLFEQRGCPYCRELHRVNFARAEIRDYLLANFNTVQIDLFGSRETTDFDGEAMEERDMASKWGVHFTPTCVLFSPKSAGRKTLAEAESFRMPGYFKPFHYISGLEYVVTGTYEEMSFQRYLQAKFADLQAKGISPDVW